MEAYDIIKIGVQQIFVHCTRGQFSKASRRGFWARPSHKLDPGKLAGAAVAHRCPARTPIRRGLLPQHENLLHPTKRASCFTTSLLAAFAYCLKGSRQQNAISVRFPRFVGETPIREVRERETSCVYFLSFAAETQ